MEFAIVELYVAATPYIDKRKFLIAEERTIAEGDISATGERHNLIGAVADIGIGTGDTR